MAFNHLLDPIDSMLNKMSDNTKITFIIFLIVLASQLIALFLRTYAENFGLESFRPLDENNQIVSEAIESFNCNEELLTELKSLLIIINNHKLHFKAMLTEFTKFRFGTALLLQNLSVLTVALAFLVTSRGWTNSNKYLKSIFLTISTLTASYAYNSYTTNQEATIEENTKNYLCFDNLEKSLLEISFDCQDSTIHNKLTSFYQELRSCNSLYWEFKDTNVQKIEILDEIGSKN